MPKADEIATTHIAVKPGVAVTAPLVLREHGLQRFRRNQPVRVKSLIPHQHIADSRIKRPRRMGQIHGERDAIHDVCAKRVWKAREAVTGGASGKDCRRMIVAAVIHPERLKNLFPQNSFVTLSRDLLYYVTEQHIA